MKELNRDIPHKCVCGRVVAFERNGRIYVKCKKCKREVEVYKAKNQ